MCCYDTIVLCRKDLFNPVKKNTLVKRYYMNRLSWEENMVWGKMLKQRREKERIKGTEEKLKGKVFKCSRRDV